VLLAYVLGIERIGLYTSFDRPLSPEEKANFRQVVKRRFSGEPTQYIVEKQEFWSLDFFVSPAVLVPRADTEVLVEEALAFLDQRNRQGRVLDVGTGSGAIAVSLAHECPEAEIYACDLSADALEVAVKNVKTHSVTVQLAEGRVNAMAEHGPYDVVVSNPPYIPSATIETLMAEVRDYEPRLALDGGMDGLQVFHEIIPEAASMLSPGGWLGFEVEGARQAGEVKVILERSNLWTEIRVRRDYSGLERVVCAQRIG